MFDGGAGGGAGSNVSNCNCATALSSAGVAIEIVGSTSAVPATMRMADLNRHQRAVAAMPPPPYVLSEERMTADILSAREGTRGRRSTADAPHFKNRSMEPMMCRCVAHIFYFLARIASLSDDARTRGNRALCPPTITIGQCKIRDETLRRRIPTDDAKRSDR